jgi:hypothetical protein
MTLCVEFTNVMNNGGDTLYRPVDVEGQNAVQPRENTAQTLHFSLCYRVYKNERSSYTVLFHGSSGRIL